MFLVNFFSQCRSVNPISIRGADYAHHITVLPQIFRPSDSPAYNRSCIPDFRAFFWLLHTSIILQFPQFIFFSVFLDSIHIFFIILDFIRKSKLCPCHKVLPKNLANFRCFNLDCCWLLSLKLKPFELLAASHRTTVL